MNKDDHLDQNPTQPVELSAVLTKAFIKASTLLGLSDEQKATFIQVTPQNFAKLGSTELLQPDSEEGRRAAELILLVQSLHGLTGGDKAVMRRFMGNSNKATGGKPIEQIMTKDGMQKVLRLVEISKSKG